MIEKFKSNAEAIATADKYLYGNHARMPIVMDRGEKNLEKIGAKIRRGA